MEISWLTATTGGVLIGISATILLAFNGRIAGISGIVNGCMEFPKPELWRWFFIIGMLAGGSLFLYAAPQAIPKSEFMPWQMIIGGFLVGIGTRMGNGCTSGHGVCGLGRLSMRSLVAVLCFMGAAIVTVFITRHLLPWQT
jgi:uncharacterized membrane protein YedE/YeeE